MSHRPTKHQIQATIRRPHWRIDIETLGIRRQVELSNAPVAGIPCFGDIVFVFQS